MKKIIIPILFLWIAAPAQKLTNTASPEGSVINGKLWASLYQQKSAEYRALCLQAYNIARWRVVEALRHHTAKPYAIITDIDETILDNSPYAVHQVFRQQDYDLASWTAWTAKGIADTLSGALGFFRYAASHNVQVYYITNRGENERKGTLANLRRYGFPFADDAHLILKKDVSSKEPRRQDVMVSHNVILLLGDNLSDFSALFDKRTTAERLEATRQSAALFGDHFIVLPNPTYGDWESALNQYRYDLSFAQRDSVIRANVKGY